MGIVLAADFELPVEAVSQTFAILAKRGVGKSTTARKMAEGFAAAGCQFVAVDPVGVWWGLRSSADGQGPGLDIYIFGGEHGDLPLEEASGALLADVVMESGASVILDLSELSEAAMRRFLADFCTRLYQAKATDRRPLHLILDEADEFAPQRLPRGGERLFGAIDRIVRRGRARGLGCTLISQRPAVVNKDVLTQSEVLIAMRVTHPRDRKALEEWATAHDGSELVKQFAESLTSLDVGEAWVWSPGWLDVFRRVRIALPWTYDSSYTPKPGDERLEPVARVEVDLDALGERIAATREQVAANDPAKLKARVRELEATLESESHKHGLDHSLADQWQEQNEALRAELAEVCAANDVLLHNIELYRGLVGRIGVEINEVVTSAIRVQQELNGGVDESSEAVTPARATRANEVSAQSHRASRALSQGRSNPAANPDTATDGRAPARPVGATPARESRSADDSLSKSERAVLTVLAQHGPCESGRLALLAGYRWSGGFRNTLSALRTKGWIEGSNSAAMTITEGGVAALGDFTPLPTGRALLDYWLADPRLGIAEREVLAYVYQLHGDVVSGEAVAIDLGRQYSGGFRNVLSKLRTAGLIEGPNAGFRAAAVFLEGGC